MLSGKQHADLESKGKRSASQPLTFQEGVGSGVASDWGELLSWNEVPGTAQML